MTGSAVSRKSIVIPRALRKRLIEAADLATVLDRPCGEHRGTKPVASRGCEECDRYDARRARRFMRSRGIAIEHDDRRKGKRVVTTLVQLIGLDGIGDVVLQLLTPEQVKDLVA
jgi:hypothetical protein